MIGLAYSTKSSISTGHAPYNASKYSNEYYAQILSIAILNESKVAYNIQCAQV